MELLSVFGGYFRRKSNAASDRHHAEQDVARQVNRYDRAVALYLPSIVDNTHLTGNFTPAKDIPSTSDYIQNIVKQRFLADRPFDVIVTEEDAGGVWLNDEESDMHAIKLLDALIIDQRSKIMNRFALMSIQVPSCNGLNTLMFYRLGGMYYSLIQIQKPELVNGSRSGEIGQKTGHYGRGIFGELYDFLKANNGKGYVYPDFENFLVAPFSKVAVEAYLTNPKHRVVA